MTLAYAGCKLTRVKHGIRVEVTDERSFMSSMITTENRICELMEEHRREWGSYPTRLEVDQFTHAVLREFDNMRLAALYVPNHSGSYCELPRLDPFQGLQVLVWDIDECLVRVEA